MSSGRHRKFLRIELTEERRSQLERWRVSLYGPNAGIDLSHVATAMLDVELAERMRRLEREAAEDAEDAAAASAAAASALVKLGREG